MSTVTLPEQFSSCKDCALGKMDDRPHSPSDKCAIHSLGFIHSDLVGPMPMESRACAYYVLTSIVNYSGFAMVAFLCTKDAVLQHFQSMVSWAEISIGHVLTSVHSD